MAGFSGIKRGKRLIIKRKRVIFLMIIKIGKNKSAALYYLFSSAFVKGVLFIITPLLSRALQREEFGLYALYTGYLSIFSVLFSLEMSGFGIYRELSLRKNRGDFLFSLFILQLCLSLALLFVYLLFKGVIDSYTGLSTKVTFALILQIFLNSAEGLYLAKCRYELKYRRCAAVSIFTGVFGAVLGLFLILFGGLSYEGRVLGDVIVSLIAVLPISISLLSGAKFDKSVLKYALFTLLPLLPHYLSKSVSAQSGKIVISRLIGEGALGAYGAALSLSLSLGVLTLALSNAVYPYINRNFTEESFTRVGGILKKTLLLLLPITVLFLLFAPSLFKILYPFEYYVGISALYPLILSQPISFISGVYNQLIFRVRGVTAVSRISIFGAFLSVFLGYILAPRLGIFGVGLSVLITESVLSLLKAAFFMKRGGFLALAAPFCLLISFCFFVPYGLYFSNIF